MRFLALIVALVILVCGAFFFACGGIRVKVAVAVVSAFRVTAHEPEPEQPPPDQPPKREPAAGTAVRVTTVAELKALTQVLPQSIPTGELVTVPVPVPCLLTVRFGILLKVAVMVASLFTVTWQELVPEQPPPDQPAKNEPAAGAAARVTTVAGMKPWTQVLPQSIPAGELVTVPVPVPCLLTVRL
jgi:hypothetical protein